MGIVIRPAVGQGECHRPHACIKHGCHLEHQAGPRKPRLARRPGRLGRLGRGQPGRDVSGEDGQIRIRPRRERLADPQVELVLGQPPLHERGLQRADHLLAVAMRGPQITAARCWRLIWRFCHHRLLC